MENKELKVAEFGGLVGGGGWRGLTLNEKHRISDLRPGPEEVQKPLYYYQNVSEHQAAMTFIYI